MRRIKLMLATVAALAMMTMAATPAAANHLPNVWEWWEAGDDWWCLIEWEQNHDESWEIEFFGCWHPDVGWQTYID